MLQFAVYRQGRFQSGNSICRISGILLGRSADKLDEMTLTVFFSTKADVSGILVIIDFEYRTILTQKTEIESALQLIKALPELAASRGESREAPGLIFPI